MSVSSLLQKAKRTRFAARCLCADEKNGAHGIAITPASHASHRHNALPRRRGGVTAVASERTEASRPVAWERAPVTRHLGRRCRRLPQVLFRHRQPRRLCHQKEAAVAAQRLHPAAPKARREDLALVAIELAQVVVVARMALVRLVGGGEDTRESLAQSRV